MKHLALLALVLCQTGIWAAQEKPVSAARLLDEVIVRPGDFDQLCDGPQSMPFAAPPIPAYGFSVPQTLFLSEEMKAKLWERRGEVVKEMASRLEKLDWLNPPLAPPVSDKPLYVKPEPGNTEFDPTKPSGQNPRAVGSIMLTIVADLEAVEVLPQLLRLEDSLHQITQAALKDSQAAVPSIDTGGGVMWDGMIEEEEKLGEGEPPPEFKRKQRLFRALVFDRQILGVMLRLLQQKHFAPLKDSTPGLMRAVVLRRKAYKNEDFAKIKSDADVPENDRRYLSFDKDAGVPAWHYEHANMLYSEPLRLEVRGLAQAYLGGTTPPKVSGAEVLAEALQNPGSYSQMCAMPIPLPFDAPVPAYGTLAPRHYHFSLVNEQTLQAHRQQIIPLLIEKLHALDVIKPTPKDQPYSLLLGVVRTLHAIEALSELLRIEDQLHGALSAVQNDDKASLPQLNLDSPVTWIESKKAPSGKADNNAPEERRRKAAAFNYRVLQREIIGLIGQLLKEEDFAPYLTSALHQGYIEGLRAAATEGELKAIKKIDDTDNLKDVTWDEKLNIPVKFNGPPMKVPYTEALRNDLRKVANEFLRTVPPENRKGEAAMNLVISERW